MGFGFEDVKNPQPKYGTNTGGGIESAKNEKPRNRPNFEFRPLDKDSFSLNMGSMTESTLEGSLLAQNIPASIYMNATKLPSSSPTNKGFNRDAMLFKPKQKESSNFFHMKLKLDDGLFEGYSSTNKKELQVIKEKEKEVIGSQRRLPTDNK